MNPHVSAKRMWRIPMRVYSRLSGALRNNRTVFRILFGFTPPGTVDGILWDWTTLALRHTLRGMTHSGTRLLDMGTGPAAVLAVYARNTLHCKHVCAVDHLPEIVSSATAAVRRAHAEVTVRESSLFESVTGVYDLIVFNAPYISSGDGARLGLLESDTARRRWCGGKDGMETIDSFLAGASGFLAPEGVLLLGVNHFYVSPGTLADSITRHGWKIARLTGNRWNRAAVYRLTRPA